MNQYPPQYPAQYLPPQYPQAPGYAGPVRRRLRRVGVFSAAKVFAMMTALFYAIFGLITLVFGTLCSGLLASAIPAARDADSRFGAGLAGGLIGSVVVYIILIVFGFIAGFIIGAIYAWIYNLSVGLTGGLEVDVS